MSILIIMILNPFTRPINAWVTVLVVALHGATVWAMMSMDIPDPPNVMTKPKTIQIELITSKSLSTETSSPGLPIQTCITKSSHISDPNN